MRCGSSRRRPLPIDEMRTVGTPVPTISMKCGLFFVVILERSKAKRRISQERLLGDDRRGMRVVRPCKIDEMRTVGTPVPTILIKMRKEPAAVWHIVCFATAFSPSRLRRQPPPGGSLAERDRAAARPPVPTNALRAFIHCGSNGISSAPWAGYHQGGSLVYHHAKRAYPTPAKLMKSGPSG